MQEWIRQIIIYVILVTVLRGLIMKPQYEQYATFNEQANNPNENMSAVLVFVMSLMVFAASLFLSLDSAVGVWLKLFVASLLASSAKVTTFITKIKVFYKEK